MTTVRDLVQTTPQKTEALLGKLADTSAPRERDRLFAELKREVETQLELEEKHLLPALEEHAGTKGLVPALQEANRHTRDLLTEARDAPKDGEAFAAKLDEMRRAFHRQIHDDRNQLLPAVANALSGAEVSAIAGEVEGDKARIEARREGAEAPQSGGRRKRSPGMASGPEESGPATRTGRGRTGADAGSNSPTVCVSSAPRPNAGGSSPDDRRSAERLVRASVGAGSDAAAPVVGRADGGSGHRTATSARPDRPAAPDAGPIGGVLTALLGEQTDHAMRAAAAIGRSTTLAEVAVAQTDFVGGSVRRMMRANGVCLAFLRGGVTGSSVPPPRR